MVPVPPPQCGFQALLLPLIHTQENAFNPCFLLLLVLTWGTLLGAVTCVVLFRYLQKPSYGPLAAKNTGLFHWLRCSLVVLHTFCWARLFWAVSLVERQADSKIISVSILTFVSAFVVAPLHFIETTRSLIPLGPLLVFWPGMAVLDLMLWFQDLHTQWPVFLFELGPFWEAVALVAALAVSYLESSRSTWVPSHLLLFHLQASPHPASSRPPHFLEKITFSWMNPLVTNSLKNQTVLYQDLPEAPAHLTTENYTRSLQRHLDHSQKKSTYALFLAIMKAFGPVAAVSFSYEACDSLLAFVQPQLLRLLILFMGDKIKDPLVPILRGFLLCFGMFIVTLVQTVFNNQYVLKVLEVGLGCRSSLTSLIFQKSIRLSAHSRSERSSGDIVNLVSIDAPRVQTCAQEISTLIIAPAELVLSIWSLYKLLGKSAFAGLFVMLAFVPVNTFFVRYLKKLNKVQMKLKDNRNRITNEILVSMKSIKLYSWEMPMLKRLFEARNEKELKNSKKIRIVNQCGSLIWTTMPFLVSFLTFAIFALVENRPLTSEIVFPGLTLLNILSRPILLFPSVITYITEATVALERISAFLSAPEVDPNLIEVGSGEGRESLNIKNTSFLWQKSQLGNPVSEETEFTGHKYALYGINMTVNKGDFVCIVGRVGAGKSSFLSSILGQLDAVDSLHPSLLPRPLRLGGSVGYCSQNPWIMNASVKENITFGHRFDEDYYQQTIRACQLLSDLKILPDGDETQVGEKGISLSGGQKARLSLARAVYARADIYLLDDILSAVDSHVGKNIISRVLTKSGLLSGKTIIFATNNIPVLEHADKIYLFEKGTITEQAPFDEVRLSALYPQLSTLVSEYGNYSSRSQSPETGESEDEELADDIQSRTNRKASLATFKWDPFKEKTTRRTGNTLETSAKGKVDRDVYINYIKACSISGMSLWVGLFVLATIASISTNYWLKRWTEANSNIGDNTLALHFIAIYAVLGFTTSALNLLKGLVFFVFMSIRGGRKIHDRMATRLMKAPMNFFERTPVGRIMNRFSNDINKVDSALPRSLNVYMGSLLSTVSTIVVVALALPAYLVVVVILGFVYGYYQKYYISVQRELKRLVSISRSPIFAHFQESLSGVETIKAYQQEDRFNLINNANVDFNMRTLFMLRSINRWLSVRLQFIGSLVIWTSSTMLIYKSTTASPISAGMAGFVMSYALQVTDTFKKMVRMSAEVEANIVAVERCLEYCKLPTEENETDALLEAPANWPKQGAIDIHNYSTRYAKNLDLVLKNISISVESGEKVGVVGRTGAGKSSLVLALFRMIPPVDGSIFVDGIDITKISLFNLRHNLSIIPQDSHLFEGTLRQNLDPFEEYSDAKLWEVLVHAKLKETVEELGEGLDSLVKEGGSNFSAGQRQLMCLGRALLNPSRVLMLDEATAAVDVQTDKIIQSTIRTEFKEKTIVTIAHRLDTVMDCDRILSLDHGEVKEFDTPANLLKDPTGVFYNLCKQGNYI
ncbi:P-loop containing nucleoside triphosphate hydrolase protein [Metschnikowia bicuspidata var. bicuspidata NRRL YB-4993]|uniref:p-loop containing nucleoside triphosphate hydrolase protein n=1 Tax=Metschnikowia bicuspidata var. bicuspidata NRRL YB-4993 TaxID=869754 RepID=A0A1A0HDG2_9ASCO|nr:P-loop containing nucleoside triphosphate hydrolase protein [Metschnikowia bicuspidata var. bicuspidata NRRL YB-4993]OBA22056.1 P-loop containing nucleoside triphosphate hydrolase protein [Metschnikowia bicuspidata var. bicuspidata NRRL YB-4993]